MSSGDALSRADAGESRGITRPIFVTGATGTVGSFVVRKLVQLGVPVVAGVRDVARARASLGDSPSLTLLDFDFVDTAKVDAALHACSPVALFLLRPPELTNVAIFRHTLTTAAAAGCEHVVFLSLIGVDDNPFVPHHAIEAAIRDSFAPPARTWTMLRSGFFAQNLSGVHAVDVREHDEIFVPAGGGKTSFVDARDIADVAVLALTHRGEHAGAAYALTGSEALTYGQVASMMSDVLGRKISYANPFSAAFAARMRARGQPWSYITIMILLYAACWLGRAADLHGTELARLLGRQPTSMRQFLMDYAHAFAPASHHE